MTGRHHITLIAWLTAATVLMSLAGLTAGTPPSQAQSQSIVSGFAD